MAAGATLPAETLQSGRDAALIGGADFGQVDVQAVAGDFEDGRAAAGSQKLGNRLLPGISLVAGLLLGSDMLVLEVLVWPPR